MGRRGDAGIVHSWAAALPLPIWPSISIVGGLAVGRLGKRDSLPCALKNVLQLLCEGPPPVPWRPGFPWPPAYEAHPPLPLSRPCKLTTVRRGRAAEGAACSWVDSPGYTACPVLVGAHDCWELFSVTGGRALFSKPPSDIKVTLAKVPLPSLDHIPTLLLTW